MLLILSGLPGSGKTTIARELARRLRAAHLRIDTIEEALRASRSAEDLRDTGYRVAYALAEDNLRLGLAVVADSVNPIALTRDAWVAVAERAAVGFVEIEIRCSDGAEHRRRVEGRLADRTNAALPSWADVAAREYRAWDREHLVIDTARLSADESVQAILDAIG